MNAPSTWRWPLALILAGRYLRGRRSRLLHRTALSSLASVSLGVTALVVAMALMSGYRHELEEKLVAGNAAILAYPLQLTSPPETESVRVRLTDVARVQGVRSVTYGQGTLSVPGGREGESVTLRGIPDGPDPLVGRQTGMATDDRGVAGAVLGADLARELGLVSDDRVRLTAMGFEDGRPRFRFRTLRVIGTFRSGFAEFDRRWVVLDRDLVRELSGEEGVSTLYEISVENAAEAPEIAGEVQAALGEEFLVTDWQELNSELFAALELQQLSLFFLLGLIVLVSTFNVASTLMVLVRERLREVGVLVSLGLVRRQLALAFVGYGLALGVVGIALGTGLGSFASWILTTFEVIRFDPEVAEIYFISSVPFRLEAADLLAIVGFALLVCLASTLPPAWQVLRVRVADALRYE